MPRSEPPEDAAQRRGARPVTVYAVEELPRYDEAFYDTARTGMALVDELTVPPRDARAFRAPAGCLFRIVSIEGPQVGDLNLWNAHDLTERFEEALDGLLLPTAARVLAAACALEAGAAVWQRYQKSFGSTATPAEGNG